jgi:hypothetical protein
LGTALIQLGATGEAEQHLRTSLVLAQELAHPDIKALPLIGIAHLLAATGHPGEAIDITACVVRQPTTWNEVKLQASRIMESARDALSPEEALRWQERGEGLNIDELSRAYMENPELLDGSRG